MSVAPQVVLITGASRGFGAVATRELADRGHQIVATMRNPDRDGPAVFKGYEKNIQVTQCDVTDDATVQAAVAAAIERHGRIDVLVNNAGQSLIGAVEELADDEFRALLDVNLIGCLRLIRAMVPHMRRRRSGKTPQHLLAGRADGRTDGRRVLRLEVRPGGDVGGAAL